MDEGPDYTGPLPIDDDRPRHPYVARHPAPDLSANEWTNAAGATFSSEFQAWASRVAFHQIEGLLVHLTPSASAYLVDALLRRLLPLDSAPAAEFERITGEPLTDPRRQLDPSGAFLDFEELFGPELKEALTRIESVLDRCPGCGRRHGEVGWVHSATGDAVRVERMTSDTVYFRRQLAPSGEGGEVPQWSPVESMGRLRFEQLYVRAEGVALLGP